MNACPSSALKKCDKCLYVHICSANQGSSRPISHLYTKISSEAQCGVFITNGKGVKDIYILWTWQNIWRD